MMSDYANLVRGVLDGDVDRVVDIVVAVAAEKAAVQNVGQEWHRLDLLAAQTGVLVGGDGESKLGRKVQLEV
jgi:hypothetical protein